VRRGVVDLVLKGRGIRITDQIRRSAEHKATRIARLDPRARRLEIEIQGDLNPRVGATHRAKVACERGRHTFRAEGAGHDVDSALDQGLDRLERQMATHRGKLRNRLLRRSDRLRLPGTSQEWAGNSE
jgi:ribosomal subunit interface protein